MWQVYPIEHESLCCGIIFFTAVIKNWFKLTSSQLTFPHPHTRCPSSSPLLENTALIQKSKPVNVTPSLYNLFSSLSSSSLNPSVPLPTGVPLGSHVFGSHLAHLSSLYECF